MKRFLCLFVVACFVTGSCLASAPMQGNIQEQLTTYAVVVWDGIAYPLTEEETELFKTNPEAFEFYNIENLPSGIDPMITAYYERSTMSNYIDSAQRQYVSSLFYGGPNGGTLRIDTTQSYTATFTTGGSLSSTIKNTIAASVSTSASVSASTGLTQSISYPIPVKQYARVAFSPRVIHTTGNWVEEYNQVGGTTTTKKTPVNAKFLVKLGNGFADGLYEPIYKSVQF